MDNQNVNIGELNQALSKNYIHYDPSRVDYSVNNFELELIEQTGSSIWKDVFLASICLAIPCLINAYAEYSRLPQANKVFNSEVFLNCLIGGLGLALSIISLIVWQKNKSNFSKIIQGIKNKPKYEMPK